MKWQPDLTEEELSLLLGRDKTASPKPSPDTADRVESRRDGRPLDPHPESDQNHSSEELIGLQNEAADLAGQADSAFIPRSMRKRKKPFFAQWFNKKS